MQVKVENVSSVSKKLTFEIGAERVNQEIAAAYQQIGKTAKVKGFRPGKIPRSVLEKYYEPQMQEKVFTRLINDTYFKALAEHQIPAVSEPRITESGNLEQGKSFSYAAEVDIRPEPEVTGYTGLELKKEKLVIDESVVDTKLEELRTSRSELKVSSRKKARQGDFVTIDFEGFTDGTPFEGGKAEGHVLELGSGSFIPGFEEQLEGMKRDEEKEIEVTFPEAYGNKQLAGKPATFKVRLHEIKEKEFPAVDDAFAKEFGADSLDELRKNLLENATSQEQGRIDTELRERLMDALIERNSFEIPEAMVDQQLAYMLENVRNRMQAQGMSLEMLGMNEESFRRMYRDTAIGQVRGSLILQAVGRQEQLEVVDEEVDGKLEQIATMANAPLDVVKKYYAAPEARQQLMGQLLEEKVIEFLLAKAKVAEVSKETLQAEKAAADESEPAGKEN